jgi:hypothetical protein
VLLCSKVNALLVMVGERVVGEGGATFKGCSDHDDFEVEIRRCRWGLLEALDVRYPLLLQHNMAGDSGAKHRVTVADQGSTIAISFT